MSKQRFTSKTEKSGYMHTKKQLLPQTDQTCKIIFNLQSDFSNTFNRVAEMYKKTRSWPSD